MFARQELAHFRQVQNPRQELGRDIAPQEAIAVLAEDGCIPYGVIRRKTHKPAEQKIIVELLHQQPLGAHAIESLEKLKRAEAVRAGCQAGRLARKGW